MSIGQQTTFNDQAIAGIVAALQDKRYGPATPVQADAVRLRKDLDTWARRFRETQRDEDATRTVGKALGDFAALCGKASNMLEKLKDNPALSGDTPARLELAASIVNARTRASSSFEGRLIEMDAELAGHCAVLGALSEELKGLAEHARTAATGKRPGAPRKDARYAAVDELIGIYERHSGRQAKRGTVGKDPKGHLWNFVECVFRAARASARRSNTREIDFRCFDLAGVDECLKGLLRERRAKTDPVMGTIGGPRSQF